MQISICLFFLITLINCDNFNINRVLQCVNQNQAACQSWKEESYLDYNTNLWSFYCFSNNTYVLTRQGPKSMRELRIGDQVFAFDQRVGERVFSKIIAWLHRDEQVVASFQIIQATTNTNKKLEFVSSNYHNIGFQDRSGKIDYKFAKDLQQGDALVGFNADSITVQQTSNYQQGTGLYAPYTETGNYFIYDNNFNPQSSEKSPMILAHVLSQVKNVQSQFPKAQIFMSIYEFSQLNYQPKADQKYVHPLISKFSFIFGQDWVDVKQQVKYDINYSSSRQLQQNHDYSSYSSSSSDAERRRRDLMKSMGLAISITQQTVLF